MSVLRCRDWALLPLVALCACGPGDDTGGALAVADLAVLTTLEGSQVYGFYGLDVYDPCQRSWEGAGVSSGTDCTDCDAVFSVDYTFEAEWGDCSPHYGSQESADFHGYLGFALDHEGGGPVVGPVVSGRLYWGGGSVVAPASAAAEITVLRRHPLELAWTYVWTDPWGYYYNESWGGELTLR